MYFYTLFLKYHFIKNRTAECFIRCDLSSYLLFILFLFLFSGNTTFFSHILVLETWQELFQYIKYKWLASFLRDWGRKCTCFSLLFWWCSDINLNLRKDQVSAKELSDLRLHYSFSCWANNTFKSLWSFPVRLDSWRSEEKLLSLIWVWTWY